MNYQILCPECESLVEVDHVCVFCEEILLWRMCFKCRNFVRADSESCPNCSTSFSYIRCPFCDKKNDIGTIYCSNCGNGVAWLNCPFCGNYSEINNYCSRCSSVFIGIECPECESLVYHLESCNSCGCDLPSIDNIDGDKDDDDEGDDEDCDSGINTESQPVIHDRVSSIGRCLLGDSRYECGVVPRSDINGFADGKKIMITSAAVEKLDNDQLAYIIAHEAIHNDLEHPSSSKNRYGANIEVARKSLALGALFFAGNRFIDRIEENIADELAISMMEQAGFDPSKSLEVLHKFDQQGSSLMPGFLRSHSDNEVRRDKIRRKIDG